MKTTCKLTGLWLLAALWMATRTAVCIETTAIKVDTTGCRIVRMNLASPTNPSDTREEGLAGLLFGPDGCMVVTGSSKYGGNVAVRIWDLQKAGAKPVELDEHVGPLDTISLSGEGRLLASGDYDGTIRLWSLTPKISKMASFQWFRYQVRALALSTKGDLLAASGDSGVIGLMDLNRPSQAQVTLRGHENLVTSLAFSPDSGLLASSSSDGTIRVWSVDEPGKKPIVLHGHQADFHPANKNYDRNYVRQVVFTPDGRFLIAGAGDGSVQIWNVSRLDGSPRVFDAHNRVIDAISVNRASTRLATAGRDHKIRVWDLTSLDASPPLVINCGETWASDLAFDPTGTYIGVVIDGTVQLFHVKPIVPEAILID